MMKTESIAKATFGMGATGGQKVLCVDTKPGGSARLRAISATGKVGISHYQGIVVPGDPVV